MILPLCSAAAPPTLGDHLEDITLLLIGLAFVVLALVVGDLLFGRLARRSLGKHPQVTGKPLRRKRRRSNFRKHRPAHLRLVAPCEPNAREALARAAGRAESTTTRAEANLRLVEPRRINEPRARRY